MTSIRKISALVSVVAALSLTACGNAESSGSITYSENENVTSDVAPAEEVSSEKEAASPAGASMAEFLLSEEGLEFQKTANRAVIAYLRNDREKLSQCMADPGNEAGLSEAGADVISDFDYMVFRIPDSFDVTPGYNGVYPASYEYVIEGTEMKMYLDLGLRLTDNGWRVEYIDLQG